MPLSRRRLLKTLLAAGGATAVSTLVPSKWSKPLIEVGVLPAHAPVSPPLGTGDLQVTVTWNNGDPACTADYVDVDLHVVEPDTTRVMYSNPNGTTATLDVDNTCGLGPENIFVAAGQAAAGVYQVQVIYYRSGGIYAGQPTTATIRITVFDGTPSEAVYTFTRTMTSDDCAVGHLVADITFPAGTVVEQTGTVTVPC